MKKLKKKQGFLLLGGVLAAGALGVGIWFAASGGAEPVNVYPFHYLGMTEYWGDSRESYGPVTTDKIQTVFLSDTQTVTEVMVKTGDKVKKGDVLMTFDTTLDDLSLERKRLDVEKLKLQQKAAQEQLNELWNMEPMVPDYGAEEEDLGEERKDKYTIHANKEYSGAKEESAMICWLDDKTEVDDLLLEKLRLRSEKYRETEPEEDKPASSASGEIELLGETSLEPTETSRPTDPPEPSETSKPTDPPEPTETSKPTDPPEPTETSKPTDPPEPTETSKPTDPPEPTETSKPTDPPEPTETSKPTDPPEPTETSKPTDPPETTEPSETTEPTEPSETTEPTEEATEPTEETTEPTEETTEPTEGPEHTVESYYVVFKITEDNMSLGAQELWQGVHVMGTLSDGFALKFFNASAVPDHSLEPKEEEEPLPDFSSGLTAVQIAEMSAQQQKLIKELKVQIRMAEAEYKIMEAELNDGHIYAKIDGEVVSALEEEEARENQQPILKVSGGGGFYIECSVSELEMADLDMGQEVTINDWNTGSTYTGEVVELRDFPSSEDNWNGSGNPNVSYYPFRVFVDGEADLQEGSYVSVMYSTGGAENGLYLENAFLRTEQGRSYVWLRGKNGKLEQRFVTVGKSLWGSYTEILDGLTEEDLLAFPYGKDLKNGAPTVEADISELYSY